MHYPIHYKQTSLVYHWHHFSAQERMLCWFTI